MNFFRKQLDKFKPHFDKGGKFEKYAPAFNGIDTFLFVPNHTTKHGAHIRDGVDLKRVMITVVIALLPALIFGMWNVGYMNMGDGHTFMDYFIFGAIRFLPMIIVSYGVGLGIEFAYAVFRGHDVNEGYLVTGLLIPMIMPIDFPLWMLAISVIFAVIVGKEAFGGTGMNILNPALVARAFALFSYAPFMSGNTVWVADSVADGVSGETVLGSLAAGTEVQYSTFDMFMGYIPGSVGETSVLMILIGAALLLFAGIASWRIMLSCLIGASLMGLLFNAIGSETNELLNFPWWQHLIAGGFAFGLVFMATDPVSAAQTTKGKWIYGFLIGIFAILIRVVNPTLPEGMMMAILLLNVFAPTIDHYVVESNVKRRKKRLQKVSA
ncbi:NADH:ubiquinone reductase (Na(+)-transporting) subunit B [Lutimonas zeaxanthinifaciens]|uniref:NADH:ubiquinone reductase (Na(+)-transporting) subunit B n=1 Tax=Lutimonas zeaxanthinifaciens TaxID=3060215 RepID=UPI00265CD1B0|nr:NADH:ubiquinone reductase (Na(+)-transporting) subunit B [Lutimonas sp. YSD2104]WKK65534.1 NADH:ubiquinone reductase (Na(+)-transporting) subunit B [Lutimonas sp. YSD2104]